MARPATIILDYGKRPPARWRRLVRWAVVALLLVTLALAGLFALRNLVIWVARRQGYATVATWYEQAATTVVPAGTLLYSERPEDLSGTRSTGWSAAVGSYESETFELPFPSLRQIGYDRHGVPQPTGRGVLYVHEHDYWDVPSGKRPALICIRYGGLDAQRRPQFFAMSYRMAGPSAKPPIPAMGSVTFADGGDGRSFANLRIFAGAPHPTDAARFHLPFDCDGGRGRFEFRTDTDVTDGGKLAPDVWIEWDDGPATRSAS